MKRILRLITVTSLMALMVTGCGKNNSKSVNTDSKTSEASESANENAKTEDENAKDIKNGENPKGVETGGAESIFPFTYTDAANREVLIEKEPLKVAISYLPHWESLIMLDAMPIATTAAEHYRVTWDPFMDMDLSSVVDLGDSEINLELLAELEPDIILEQVQDVSNVNVENLEKIAPVVVFGDKVKMDWRYSLREIGKVIGRAEKAEEVIAEIDGKLASARTQLQERYADQTVMLMSFMGEDRYFCAYRPDLYDKETGLGLTLPEGFTTSETYEQVSMEALVEMDPDYLFVNVFDGSEALFKELYENSVWNSLTAVKEGHVFMLDGSGHAASALSTVHTVDFIVETLLEN